MADSAGVRCSAPKRLSAMALASLMLAACGSGAVASPAAVTRELVWADPFNGQAGLRPDSTRWLRETGGNGWGNGELQCYTHEATTAALDGAGHLVIQANKRPGTRCSDGSVNGYTSARLTTRWRFQKTHGRIEVRAQLPSGRGTWPAFWALGADFATVGWPRSGEIDVMEYAANKPGEVSGTLHGLTYGGGHWYLPRTTVAPGVVSGFHVFAAEWTTDSVTFSVDGVDYGRVNRAEVERYGTWRFDKPFFLLLNLAVGGTLGGSVPATTTWPQRFVIDYVRVYR